MARYVTGIRSGRCLIKAGLLSHLSRTLATVFSVVIRWFQISLVTGHSPWASDFETTTLLKDSRGKQCVSSFFPLLRLLYINDKISFLLRPFSYYVLALRFVNMSSPIISALLGLVSSTLPLSRWRRGSGISKIISDFHFVMHIF